MEFYQTVQGKRFFEHTLPQISKALQRISESLSTPAPCIHISQQIPKNFLTELYWERYYPGSKLDSDMWVQYSSEIRAAQETVKAQVAPEVYDQIDKIIMLMAVKNNVDQETVFAIGFRAATTMLAAGLSEPDHKGAA